jgi:hypothetical protein
MIYGQLRNRSETMRGGIQHAKAVRYVREDEVANQA